MAKTIKTGTKPKAPSTANLIFKKGFQDAYIAGRNNPAQFARDFLDFDPYPGQDDFLFKWKDTKEAIFNAGNRVGKSFISGVILLYKAFYRHFTPFYPNRRSQFAQYYAMATSLTYSQANIAFDYAVNFAQGSPRFKSFIALEPTYSPHASMEIHTILDNGERGTSRIEARSLAKRGTHLLGLSLSFILVDETAFVPEFAEIQDTILRGRLLDQGGSMLKISSPNGHNHFYYEFNKWFNDNGFPENGKNAGEYLAYRLTTYDNPHITAEALAEIKERMLPELFQQNIMAQFITLSDFFSADAIKGLYSDRFGIFDVVPNDKTALYQEFPEPWRPDHTYVAGIDLGFKRDPTVIFVLDMNTNKVVFVKRMHHVAPPQVRAAIMAMYKAYRPVKIAVDATGVGMTFTEELRDTYEIPGIEAFTFSAPSKLDILTRLQNAVYRRAFVFPFVEEMRTTIDQLSFYQLDDKKLKQDDVMALALLNYAAEEVGRRDAILTDIPDNLVVTPVSYGQSQYAGLDEELGGVSFRYDPELGILVPNEDLYGGYFGY